MCIVCVSEVCVRNRLKSYFSHFILQFTNSNWHITFGYDACMKPSIVVWCIDATSLQDVMEEYQYIMIFFFHPKNFYHIARFVN